MHLPRLLRASRGQLTSSSPCRCEHQRFAHEHYRSGSDCALCECRRYRYDARQESRQPRIVTRADVAHEGVVAA